MATPAKKQSFLGGAAILAAAVVIVKLIGLQDPSQQYSGQRGTNLF